MNEKKEQTPQIKLPHILNLEGRKNLSLTGVKEVDGYDDKTVSAITSLGGILIKGESLNIKKLSLETGDLEITGKIFSIISDFSPIWLSTCFSDSNFL